MTSCATSLSSNAISRSNRVFSRSFSEISFLLISEIIFEKAFFNLSNMYTHTQK